MSYLNTLNSLLTSTTSRYASLRRNLTSTSEDDSAITDPSDSHVSRVLRAYYAEKGRPFPAWLGTDPRDAARAQQKEKEKENPYASSRPLGSLRGNSGSGQEGAERPGLGRGLSDLWSESPGPPAEERGGLRRGPLGGRRMGAQGQQQPQESLTVRPLPSQRAGSYQMQSQAYAQQQQQQQQLRGDTSNPGPPPGSSGSGSAQERLKARLGRGSSTGSSGGGEGGKGSYATQGLSGWQGRRG